MKTLLPSWSEKNGIDLSPLEHLRSIRKIVDPMSGTSRASSLPTLRRLSSLTLHEKGSTRTSLLISPSASTDLMPNIELPDGLSPLTLTTAPSHPARTKEQLKAKNKVWPCIYAPKRGTEGEGHVWSGDEIEWVRSSMKRVIDEANDARNLGEVFMLLYFLMSADYLSSLSRSFQLRLTLRSTNLLPLNLWHTIPVIRHTIR